MGVGYFVRETGRNLRRNSLMAIAAVSTVAISLLLLGGVQVLGIIVDNLTLGWEAKVEISAFLRRDATTEEINGFQQKVAAMPQVEYVSYVSQAEALEEFKQTYADEPELYEALDETSLPASLQIKLTDAQFTEEVAASIRGAPGVDDVEFGGGFIPLLLRVNSLLRSITLGLSLVLMAAAGALIANTIRVGIYARRDEISIMKLVGATNWFIQVPFMLEGLLAALVGALVAGGIVLGVHLLLFPRIAEAIPFLSSPLAFSSSEVTSVLGLLVGVGAAVGLAGSGLAVRRFLDA